MEKLTRRLALFMVKKKVIAQEQVNVYSYGLQSGAETMLCIITSLVLSIHIDALTEFSISLLIFFSLRSFTGGVHLNNYVSCYLCSTAIHMGTIMFSKAVSYSGELAFLFILLCAFAVLFVGPIDNMNKKADEREIRYCRKMLKVILCIILLASVGLRIVQENAYIVLIANTMLVISFSMILGKIQWYLGEDFQLHN